MLGKGNGKNGYVLCWLPVFFFDRPLEEETLLLFFSSMPVGSYGMFHGWGYIFGVCGSRCQGFGSAITGRRPVEEGMYPLVVVGVILLLLKL